MPNYLVCFKIPSFWVVLNGSKIQYSKIWFDPKWMWKKLFAQAYKSAWIVSRNLWTYPFLYSMHFPESKSRKKRIENCVAMATKCLMICPKSKNAKIRTLKSIFRIKPICLKFGQIRFLNSNCIFLSANHTILE